MDSAILSITSNYISAPPISECDVFQIECYRTEYNLPRNYSRLDIIHHVLSITCSEYTQGTAYYDNIEGSVVVNNGITLVIIAQNLTE